MHFSWLLFALLLATIGCGAGDGTAKDGSKSEAAPSRRKDKSIRQDTDERRVPHRKLYTMTTEDGSDIGTVYAIFINDSVFTRLEVVNENDTIYQIDSTRFIGAAGLEETVYENGFYGYVFRVKEQDYFTVSYLRNSGRNISDDITVEWNPQANRLELMKLP